MRSMHVVHAGPSGSEELGSRKEHAGNEEHIGNDENAVGEELGRSQDQSTMGKRLHIEGHAI
ncbi:hypothetical protein [Paenibacillus sp. SSG-1]|uniref:hypothetical protein n=1 Tax=Paenibacillus sp. SSG-1 TaxID=1443669 RepID=UPI0011804760|nr:hypothetical protein [Paenibacillus sp. SSG-1]